MFMTALTVYAGSRALAHIRQNGLQAADIKLVVGASGGPKWFVLSGLDQYLIAEFFNGATQDMDFLGSSVGSWRMACYAVGDAAAIRALEDAYKNHCYSAKPDAAEISAAARNILDAMLSPEQCRNIAHNQKRRLHIVIARTRKLFNNPARFIQIATLASAAFMNVFHRKALHGFYARTIATSDKKHLPYVKSEKIESVQLTADNVKPALLASGAIPFVLEPVILPGGKPRLHYDGGVIDYHFSGPFPLKEGLVLYPHFFPKVIPGWFDKNLPWRRMQAKHYENVVMLTPSKEFIASLPFGKIPDRTDFSTMPDAERIAYWTTAINAGKQMAQELDAALKFDGCRSLVRPIEEMMK
jgi:hypothetical protein